MNMHCETGPPEEPVNVILLGNMFALTRDPKFKHQLEALAAAGHEDAKRELAQLAHIHEGNNNANDKNTN